MYLSYFGLSEEPFSIAPDPRYLYMSQRHQEALAHLLYGVNAGGGFVLLTGEVGAGKTTVCRCLLEQIPESCDVAYIFNPKLTVAELLSTICVEFGIAYPNGTTSIKVFVDCINNYLLEANARGRHTVLIIDEAQNLSADVLEEMRLLTNLETNKRKLLQIILLGQPELATMLERPELRQLAQRVVARYHLGALTKAEVSAYVRHRLEMAGTQRLLFPAALMGRVYALSGGVPRVINVLCDRALLGTYVQGKERVDRTTLAQAAREVFGQPRARRDLTRPLVAALVLAIGGAAAVTVYKSERQSDEAVTAMAGAAHVESKAVGVRAKAASAAVQPEAQQWPTDVPQSQEAAYEALFRTWGADYKGGDACQHAETLGLRCRTARGGLDELRRFDRPAVLQMRDAQGRTSFGALIGLGDDSATFTAGAKNFKMPLSVLAGQWSGHYTLLWRTLPNAPKTVRPGERGPAVSWLSTHLAQLQGREPDADPVFDESMARQLKQFQLAEGLVPDGTLGPQTLTRLSIVADTSAPKLVRGKGG